MTKYKIISRKEPDGNTSSRYLLSGVPINTELVEDRKVDFRLNEISEAQKKLLKVLGLNKLETTVMLN